MPSVDLDSHVDVKADEVLCGAPSRIPGRIGNGSAGVGGRLAYGARDADAEDWLSFGVFLAEIIRVGFVCSVSSGVSWKHVMSTVESLCICFMVFTFSGTLLNVF